MTTTLISTPEDDNVDLWYQCAQEILNTLDLDQANPDVNEVAGIIGKYFPDEPLPPAIPPWIVP